MTASDFSGAARKMTPAERAFEELEGLNRFLGGTTSPELVRIAKRGHEIIDQYIDRPEEEKDALKALLVLQFGAPFMFDDTRRFAPDYGPQTAAMVEELLKGGDTANIAQMGVALAVALTETTLAQMKDPALRAQMFAGQDVNDIIAQMEGGVAEIQKHCDMAGAPRLTALMKRCVDETLAEIRMVAAQPGVKPPQP